MLTFQLVGMAFAALFLGALLTGNSHACGR